MSDGLDFGDPSPRRCRRRCAPTRDALFFRGLAEPFDPLVARLKNDLRYPHQVDAIEKRLRETGRLTPYAQARIADVRRRWKR